MATWHGRLVCRVSETPVPDLNCIRKSWMRSRAAALRSQVGKGGDEYGYACHRMAWILTCLVEWDRPGPLRHRISTCSLRVGDAPIQNARALFVATVSFRTSARDEKRTSAVLCLQTFQSFRVCGSHLRLAPFPFHLGGVVLRLDEVLGRVELSPM